ncbi:hypothetical protein CR194_11195 [Salipaludibacillus keqinensis]|jgi:uncharacterized membrane protein YsdA (DUF1294 family)|uniref:DUF1294 domain-containing protein n=1 Tax=Salipaludibacillus keqinensis TaxID=2045207 RepID=A0A323TEB9_9BACI|nr:DUF1294 domain-containing protein [Salipaludibacillus keqinensis]PYZ93712.1 hypothetical protein CR194_11195 [Salipaludibacillus keqinensis]
MESLMLLFIGYLVVINLTGVAFMAADKKKSQKGEWRISENTLMFTALIGAASGMLIASNVLRHKTRKLKFRLGLPLLIAIHVSAMIYWMY